MDTTMSEELPAPPAAPDGLGEAGCALWTAAAGEFDLDPAELAVLAEAARTVDELHRLHLALADAEVIVPGSTGQQRVNPLFAEVRSHRATLARLTTALALPDEEEEVGRTPASKRAQHAAQVRWGRRDDLVARRLGSGTA